MNAPQEPRNYYPGRMSPAGPEVSERGQSLGALAEVVKRRWLMILAITVAFAVSAVGFSFMLTPRYEAMVRLKIKPTQRVQVDIKGSSFDPQSDPMVVASEVSIMRSRDIAAAVVKRLNLSADPEFNPGLDTYPAGSEGAIAWAIGSLQEKLSVGREENTYVVDLTFSSTDPAKAATVANAIAEEYLTSGIQNRTSTVSKQAKWLDSRLSELGKEVQQADSRVAHYRASAGITQNAANGTITDQQVAPLSSQLATAEAAAAAARARLDAARAQVASGGLETVSNVLTSPVISDLRRQRAEVGREKSQINARYGPQHPESLKVADQLASIDRQIGEEARRIIVSLSAESRAADASAASLRGGMARLRGEQASDTRAAVTADSLQREADAKRTIYNQLAQTATQAEQDQNSAETQGQIIESAIAPPGPVYPKRGLFAVFGAVLGMMVGLCVALIPELLAKGVRTIEEVEAFFGVPFIASTPFLSPKRLQSEGLSDLTPPQFAVARPMSSYAEAMRRIRSAFVLGHDQPARVIAVASATPAEGKTSTAAALGRIMALSGDRVILVDCDLRRGSLANALNSAPPKGLVEVLERTAALEDAIQSDVVKGLDVLPVHQPLFTPKDLFGGGSMRALLRELSTRYDYVLLDTPPVLVVSEAQQLTALADEVIMVVRWQETPRRAVQSAINLMAKNNANILGIVLSMTGPDAIDDRDPAGYYAMYRQYHAPAEAAAE